MDYSKGKRMKIWATEDDYTRKGGIFLREAALGSEGNVSGEGVVKA